MKTIAFMGKGGVGKTTLSVHYARFLQLKGKKVCVIGIDQQNNAKELIDQYEWNIPHYGPQSFDHMSASVDYMLNHTFLSNFKEYAPLIAPDFISISAMADLFHVLKDKFEVVVLDFPPNHTGLSIVNMPNILNNLAFKAITLKNRVKKMVTGKDDTLEIMNHIWDVVKEFKAFMIECQFVGVAIPTAVGVSELSKLIEYLIVLNYKPWRVVCNMVPQNMGPGCSNCADRYIRSIPHMDRMIGYLRPLGIPYINIPDLFEHNRIMAYMSEIEEAEL